MDVEGATDRAQGDSHRSSNWISDALEKGFHENCDLPDAARCLTPSPSIPIPETTEFIYVPVSFNW